MSTPSTTGTPFQIAVARSGIARLAAQGWIHVGDPATTIARLSAAAPHTAQATDDDFERWIEGLIAVTGESSAAPAPRETGVVLSLAHRFGCLVAVAAAAVRDASGQSTADHVVSHAISAAASFLCDFPADLFDIIPADAFAPRIEYREAIHGASAIARKTLDI